MTKDREQALLKCAEEIKTLLINHGEFGAPLLCLVFKTMSEEQNEPDGERSSTI